LKSDWNIEFEADFYCLVNTKYGIKLAQCRSAIEADCRLLDSPGKVQFTQNTLTAVFDSSLRLVIHFDCTEPERLTLTTTIENISDKPLKIGNIIPLVCPRVDSIEPLDVQLVNSQDMVGACGFYDGIEDYNSYNVAAFGTRTGSLALVAGFTDTGSAFARFKCNASNGLTNLKAVYEREGIALLTGESLVISDLMILAGESLSSMVDRYAAAAAEIMAARVSKKPVTGWCSWYYYYDSATEADIWDNINAIAGSEFREKIDVIQIDDGWNLPSKEAPRIWGDWYAGSMFPAGMEALAAGIKDRGFTPGLWLAPFSVDPASRLYKDHPDWLVQDGVKPLEYWGVCGLDLSNPAALDFVRDTFTRVYDDWGFEYVKIDFLFHAILKGGRYANTKTTAELLRAGLEIIRQVAGERFILCCGCPVGPAVGICDGMRVGYDVSSRWNVPVNLEAWPMGNLNIRAAAIQSAGRQWMNRRWWQNDPDVILTRDYGSEPEKEMFGENFPEFALNPPYGLYDEEASCWAQFVWFTGGMTLTSENLAKLQGGRRELLAGCFPPNENTVRWVDCYDDPQIAVMQNIDGPVMIGIFNFSEKPAYVVVSPEKLRQTETGIFRERLSGETFTARGERIAFPAVPAHAGRVWVQV
jgi:alpha-galactosidase